MLSTGGKGTTRPSATDVFKSLSGRPDCASKSVFDRRFERTENCTSFEIAGSRPKCQCQCKHFAQFSRIPLHTSSPATDRDWTECFLSNWEEKDSLPVRYQRGCCNIKRPVSQPPLRCSDSIRALVSDVTIRNGIESAQVTGRFDPRLEFWFDLGKRAGTNGQSSDRTWRHHQREIA